MTASLQGPAPTTVGAGPTRTRGLSASRKRALVPYLFIAPFFVLFAVFVVLPVLYALRTSLYVDRIVGGETFVGLEQYRRVLGDQRFIDGVLRTVLFAVIYIGIVITVATSAAMMLDSGTVRAKRLLRLGIFLPYAVPSAVAALMWGYLYSPRLGPLQSIFGFVGLDAPNMLSSGLIIIALVNIVAWQFLGYNMLIIFTALQGIPQELYEAASVDGASRIQIATRIKLPLVRSAMVFLVFFSIIGSLQLFNEPQILSATAPDVVTSSFTPNMYAYNTAFVARQLSYSAALSFTIGAIAFVVSFGFMMLTDRKKT